MRARTTSQIDWWHAQLTDVSLDGHAPGCQSLSLLALSFLRMQNHREVVVRVLV